MKHFNFVTKRSWEEGHLFGTHTSLVGLHFCLPTFLHFTVAGRNAITAKKPRMAPAPGTMENT